MRGVGTAVAAILLLSACSAEDDSAEADPTPSPSETTASPTPSPTTAAPTTASPGPFPGIVMRFSGGRSGDPRVETIKTFVAGSADAQRSYRLAPKFRAVLSRDLQRFWATGVADVRKKGWTVPPNPTVRLVRLRGNGPRSRAVLCRWSPTTDFVRRSDGKNIEGSGRAWNRVDMTLRKRGDRWVLIKVEGKGVKQPGCPK